MFTSQDFKDQSSFNIMNEKVKSNKWNFFKKYMKQKRTHTLQPFILSQTPIQKIKDWKVESNRKRVTEVTDTKIKKWRKKHKKKKQKMNKSKNRKKRKKIYQYLELPYKLRIFIKMCLIYITMFSQSVKSWCPAHIIFYNIFLLIPRPLPQWICRSLL